MIYSLTYELRSPDKDYTSLFNFVEHDSGFGVIHVMRDSWWISSEKELNINDVCEKIRSFIGDKDHFFITRLSESEINGWLPSSSWDYFRKNIKKTN